MAVAATDVITISEDRLSVADVVRVAEGADVALSDGAKAMIRATDPETVFAVPGDCSLDRKPMPAERVAGRPVAQEAPGVVP